MSLSSLFRPYVQSEPNAATAMERPHMNRLSRIVRLTFVSLRLRRRRKARASYLNTGHLNEHLRKDIGLKRSDFSAPD